MFSISGSHRDIADIAAALFERPDGTGVVCVGQYPAITGPPDLASAFAARLGWDVAFEPISPEEMRTSIAPLIGEGPAVAGGHGSCLITRTPFGSTSSPQGPVRSAHPARPSPTSWPFDDGSAGCHAPLWEPYRGPKTAMG